MPHVVPQTWMPRLRRYLREQHGPDCDRLSAVDFPSNQSVLIRFPDGSEVHFRHAFLIADEEAGEVAVFTEHCGYHIFPLADAELEVLGSPGQWLMSNGEAKSPLLSDGP